MRKYLLVFSILFGIIELKADDYPKQTDINILNYNVSLKISDILSYVISEPKFSAFLNLRVIQCAKKISLCSNIYLSKSFLINGLIAALSSSFLSPDER